MHHIKPKILKPDRKQRDGKGFSTEELKKAGLNKADAKRLKIPFDPRRKTAHPENIKAHAAAQQKTQAKPKPRAAKNKPKK